MANEALPPPALIQHLFNHLAMPPRLPAKCESHTSQLENAIIQRLIHAVRTFRELSGKALDESSQTRVDIVCRALRTCGDLHENGLLSRDDIVSAVSSMEPEHLIILHLSAQNAGLTIRRSADGNRAICEAFEISPVSAAVLASKGPLKMHFPGNSSSIPWREFVDASFLDNFALFIEQAHSESIKRFAAVSHKASAKAFESRDTVDPALITQLLMSLLQANGALDSSPVLQKRVRDEVLWTDGAERPWRRLPFWLLLRVSVQRHFCHLLGGEKGQVLYKFFICIVLAQLSDDVVRLDLPDPEMIDHLNKKLSRRLSKLELEKKVSSPGLLSTYEDLFTSFKALFHTTLTRAQQRIDDIWRYHKMSIKKSIPKLPFRAPEEDMALSLGNSSKYLHEAMAAASGFSTNNETGKMESSHQPMMFASDELNSRYIALAELERNVPAFLAMVARSEDSSCGQCEAVATHIKHYIDTVNDSYSRNPTQSSVMILTILELWISMDQSAQKAFGLLSSYSPGLVPEILDVLQLQTFDEMARLRKVQTYIHNRNRLCHGSQTTIFADPAPGCFAEKFFDSSPHLQALYQKISIADSDAKAQKAKELQRLHRRYQRLIREMAETSCSYHLDAFGVMFHDEGSCRKCILHRNADRMKIDTYESLLPTDVPTAKAVVFELSCPSAFAAYRDSTWLVLGILACPQDARRYHPAPKLGILEYTKLSQFHEGGNPSVTLALTKKSFLSTHYSSVKIPVELEQVCLSNGLRLKMFDGESKTWTGDMETKPTFAHHLAIQLPSSNPFASRLRSADFGADSPGLSSAQIIANQTKCPTGINVHEYLAIQSLFCGPYRFWPSLLVELAASNINFSSEASAVIIPYLVSKVGPQDEGNFAVLGIRHSFLHDISFTSRLAEQIHLRLDAISRNWRELHCMEICISIARKLHSVSCCSESVAQSKALLVKARSISYGWLTKLRSEIHSIGTELADESHTRAKFAVRAALLVRKSCILEVKEGIHLNPEALRLFISAGLILQENCNNKPTTLKALDRAAMIEDIKLTYGAREELRKSVLENSHVLTKAINSVWSADERPLPENPPKWHFLEPPHEDWLQTEMTSASDASSQIIQYHLLHGYLLVNGNPLSRLPERFKEALASIAGNHAFFSYPSELPGMSYRLAFEIEGHLVHVGIRDGRTIIRATRFDRDTNRFNILELIPGEVFLNGPDADLPAPLIQDCTHWLNLETGILEIRQKPYYWKSNLERFWTIDFPRRQCFRRNSRLVNPQSPVARAIMSIFAHFENSRELCIWQTWKGNMFVELKRLELLFQVKYGSLHCRELAAYIHEDQDAGTWYGLKSMLVLRDDRNPRQRSIIVPVPAGPLHYRRDRIHVDIEVTPQGLYGRFHINHVLGRLECPAEPRLLFLKAQLHAYTSFLLPDALTGRTGTEEALQLLRSGACQPWSPIGMNPYISMNSIARLTPKRVYYPSDAKVMEQVTWNDALTVCIQHADFAQAISRIVTQSEQLRAFYPDSQELLPLESSGEDHLLERYSYRQHMYRPSDLRSYRASPFTSTKYESRDRMTSSRACIQVGQAVRSVKNWSVSVLLGHGISTIIEHWPIIGGFDRTFDHILLSDRLSVDMPSEFGALVNLCRHSRGEEEKAKLMFLVACMAFPESADMSLIRILIAIATNDKLKALRPPSWPSYEHFHPYQMPQKSSLVQIMKSCAEPYGADVRDELVSYLSRKDRKKLESQRFAHEDKVEHQCKKLADCLLSQWPCQEPLIDSFETSGVPLLIDVDSAMDLIRPEWLRLFQNFQLSGYISEVEDILRREHVQKGMLGMTINDTLHIDNREGLPTRTLREDLPDLRELVETSKIPPNFLIPTSQSLTKPKSNREGTSSQPHESKEIKELEDIISGNLSSDNKIRKSYAQDLEASVAALKRVKIDYKPRVQALGNYSLSQQIQVAQMGVKSRLCNLNAIYAQDPRHQWLQHSNLWPRTTLLDLLAVLRSSSACNLDTHMKAALVDLGVSITVLQRLLRLEDASRKQQAPRLASEQANEGHINWNPLEHPDWLLLEVDANFLIRPKQIDVAHSTISPMSGQNSVLQMNMGEGRLARKSSCVIPMVAAALADTTQLVRIIVPKALLQQMAPLLQSALGGLLDRTVKHVPFSRRTPTSHDCIQTYYRIHTDLLKSRGIVLALPEHILSFKLSGQQRMLDDRVPEAVPILRISDWFSKRCRDIIDESDFILAVRTQLIYPSGSQTTVDGHPHRWEAVESVLRLVQRSLWNLKAKHPKSIEIVQRVQDRFPFVYFLRKDAEDALLKTLTEDVCSGRSGVLPAEDMTQSEKQTIKQFISQSDPPEDTLKRVQRLFPDSTHLRKVLYLLRGLLVHRLLVMCLQKRWNVQYGLHPDRDPIAVPFQFKGVPSDQSEWGHPDVAIMLTALSFYYGGINFSQFRQSLQHVLRSSDPAAEFDRWTVNSSTLPHSSRDWTQINLDDEPQCTEVWNHLRFNMDVIDHYMNHFVYPRHAKQFTAKLQTSGWDIPLFAINLDAVTQDRPRRALTTGFSGTNDNRTMLPLTIRQHDLAVLSHTNAEVLTYLLLPRSRGYKIAANSSGMRMSELDLLRELKDAGIRMLIDAGAQVLERDNESLARDWLSVDGDARAAVYFSKSNQAMVIYRSGRPVPLLASTFANDLSRCVVYLDEAHTRGTDLKMPSSARGALTLGPGLTKDSLVQGKYNGSKSDNHPAAMRLRQLATTQSVMFFAPPEVHQSILDVQNKPSDAKLDSHDVICWLLYQTCSHIEQLQPLYYSQGMDYCRRKQASLDYPDTIFDSKQRKAYLGTIRQVEKQSLAELYFPKVRDKDSAASTTFTSTDLKDFSRELTKKIRAFQDSGIAVHGSALQEVEQEREVAIEVETVREVQEPVHYTALHFRELHHDIVTFVTKGRLHAGSAAYDHAFSVMGRTSLGLKYGIAASAFNSKLFVSSEFPKTILLVQDRPNDSFQRQVNWILWNGRLQTALIVTPEEAECIIPIIKSLDNPPTNLLTYSAPVTKKMRIFNNLNFFALPALPVNWYAPRWLKRDLSIFAGGLYFSYEEYSVLCAYLGIEKDITMSEEGETAEKSHVFTAKPLTFLHEWVALKRKGQGFTHTPMGQLCEGKRLPESHPLFVDAEPHIDYSHSVPGIRNEGQPTAALSDSEHDEFEDEADGESDAGLLDDGGEDSVWAQEGT
ncbi:hypothetical protein K490DRAFT_49259 [Saccharata proteae CBS 121410]|uniref:ubiquitinyl hydrolase 1 n=1 Tax=Saccharata proteae CBS 121410 TaxID=1314787 RepID=A0A9P4LSA4_9PEZI|nr:hypothetical protein K490DRAFT_49259 [Saccharata proteae CBS 121410]